MLHSKQFYDRHDDEYILQLSYTKSSESSHVSCMWLANGREWKTKKQTQEWAAKRVLYRGE